MKTFTVDSVSVNQRLDKFVSGAFSLSRTVAQSLLEQKKVLVNGQFKPQSYRVRENDTVTLDVDTRESLFYKQYQSPLSVPILYEDGDILVIDKPAGIAVHPAGIPHGDTVVEALSTMGKTLFSFDEKRKGVVHRLDKETSGVMLLSKSKRAYMNFVEQFKKRKIHKIYLAVVEGIVNQAEYMIDHPLKRAKNRINKMRVDYAGTKDARTFVRVLKRFPARNETLVLLSPLTGRTHQLRVHLAYESHPVIGDRKYGASHPFPRVFLHAYRIVFKHPSMKDIQEYTAAIPGELREYLRAGGMPRPDPFIKKSCDDFQAEDPAVGSSESGEAGYALDENH